MFVTAQQLRQAKQVAKSPASPAQRSEIEALIRSAMRVHNREVQKAERAGLDGIRYFVPFEPSSPAVMEAVAAKLSDALRAAGFMPQAPRSHSQTATNELAGVSQRGDAIWVAIDWD